MQSDSELFQRTYKMYFTHLIFNKYRYIQQTLSVQVTESFEFLRLSLIGGLVYSIELDENGDGKIKNKRKISERRC